MQTVEKSTAIARSGGNRTLNYKVCFNPILRRVCERTGISGVIELFCCLNFLLSRCLILSLADESQAKYIAWVLDTIEEVF